MKKLTFLFAIAALSYTPLAQPSAAFVCTLLMESARKREMASEKERQQEQENIAPDSASANEKTDSLHNALKDLQETYPTAHTTA